MNGPYYVLQTTDERFDLALAGKIMAPLIGLPLYDVRKALVEASGVLWEGLDQEIAERVAHALTASGIGAVARDATTLRRPGPMREISRGKIQEEGFIAQPPDSERLIAYADLILLTCARVKGEQKEKLYRTDSHLTAKGGTRFGYGRAGAGPTYMTIQERGTDKIILDLFARNPDEYFRIETATFKFAMANLPPFHTTFEGYRKLVEILTQRAPEAVTNAGVDVVLGKGGTWKEATFDSLEELDRHNLWMLQLLQG